jgi:hypothetical protein
MGGPKIAPVRVTAIIVKCNEIKKTTITKMHRITMARSSMTMYGFPTIEKLIDLETKRENVINIVLELKTNLLRCPRR